MNAITSNKLFKLSPAAILLVFMLGCCVELLAVTPVITHVQGIEVAPATTVNVISSTITFAGTADAGNTITLFSNGNPVAQTIAIMNNTWEVSAKNIMDGTHIFSVIPENWPETSTESNRVSVAVDTSASSEPPAYMFHINFDALRGYSELTTASSSVLITLFTNDPAGITSAKISNDGIFFETWNTPQLSPASYAWTLEESPGIKTVYMKFYNTDADESEVVTQQIGYYPYFKTHSGNQVDKTYPAGAYDEYPGENKYGAERTSNSQPVTGTSLILTVP